MRILPPTEAALAEAATVLRSGGLVVIPTETVYGLAGAIWHPQAIRRIFQVKQRPADNPLIVHIATRDQLMEVALEVNSLAEQIIEAFWPGPVTLVVSKKEAVSDQITGGGTTVAVRMPSHPVARELILRTGQPLAAPSANTFMQLSPTRAEDISPDFGSELDIVIDGGPCSVGLESTVVDCTGEVARILRPGQVSRCQIESVIGAVATQDIETRRAPGQYPRHYAPVTPLRIADRLGSDEGGLTFQAPANPRQIHMPGVPSLFASKLYAALHRLDAMHLPEIIVEAPPVTPEWAAIWDRLTRATTQG